MKVIFVVGVLSLFLGAKCSEIYNEYLTDEINSRLRGQKIDLPEGFLNELRLESENPGSRLNDISAVVNDYADEILANIRTLMKNNSLDTMKLPNKTLKLVPTGTVTLSNGFLNNTSSLSRYDNVVVAYSSTTKTVEFIVPIKIDYVSFSYDYHTEVVLLSVKGKATGKVEKLKMDVQLGFDFTSEQASLDHFDIADEGKFSLKFSGNGLVDWLINILTTIVTTFLHPVIVNITESNIKGGLDNAVDAVNSFINSTLHNGTSTLITNTVF